MGRSSTASTDRLPSAGRTARRIGSSYKSLLPSDSFSSRLPPVRPSTGLPLPNRSPSSTLICSRPSPRSVPVTNTNCFRPRTISRASSFTFVAMSTFWPAQLAADASRRRPALSATSHPFRICCSLPSHTLLITTLRLVDSNITFVLK